MLAVQVLIPQQPAIAAQGSIWTTASDCGEEQQNQNQYAIGDTIYINGTGFEPDTEYAWAITGKPGNASADPDIDVAFGTETTDAEGAICFEAYVVASDDDGEYGVDFDGKKDNYQVEGEGDEEEEDPCDEQSETTELTKTENEDCEEEEDPCDQPDLSLLEVVSVDLPFEKDECEEEEEDTVTIQADKVVCLTEADLPNWGDDGSQAGEPAMITSATAATYVADSEGRCWLQEEWSFQYGFAEKEGASGVHKLPGDATGPADGTSSEGECPAAFCGTNTNSGSGYADWKDFGSATSVNGTVSAQVQVSDLEDATGIWVRENLQTGYVPFTYPPMGATESNVSAEIYCHTDIQNYDNYDQVTAPELGNTYNCVAFNAFEGVTISAHKVVCLSEADLPNWGDNDTKAGEPAVISSTTAEEFVAASAEKCWLEEDWSFQWGFAEKEGSMGVHKLPGGLLGAADGTSTAGQCDSRFCGANTNTGNSYTDWKTFDTATSANGTVAAVAQVTDLEGASGIWVRENLQPGYVPFTYPPDGAPGSDVSAEIYCNDDIQNFDNYDQVVSPVEGSTYHCVAFNAIEGAVVKADKVVCLTEADLPNWGDNDTKEDEPAMITSTTAAEYVANSRQACWLEEGWAFQYGFALKTEEEGGVHKLDGDHIGLADGTSTTGMCDSRFCGTHTFTGTGYTDWKTFDTATSDNGVVSAMVTISDMEGAPGLWVREVLKDGYVPFSYPPDGVPGSDVSAEIYCHTDIQNFDNYDNINAPEPGKTYFCVAFNAQEDDGGGNGGDECEEDNEQVESVEVDIVDEVDECGSISGSIWNDENNNGIWDEGEPELSGWTAYLDMNDNGTLDEGEAVDVTESPFLFTNLPDGTYYVRQVVQGGWTQTFPADKHTVVISGGNDVTGQDFGNFATEQGGGGGGGGGRSNGGDDDDEEEVEPGVVLGADTGTAGNPPQVLGATLPRTGMSFLTLVALVASLFVVAGMLRARKA